MNDHVMQLQSQINFPKYKWPEGKSCAVVFSWTWMLNLLIYG